MDIRTKLVLALVSSALLSMALLGYLTYLLSFDLFLQNSSRQLAAIASSKAREFDHLIGDWRADVRRLVQQDELRAAVDLSQREPGSSESRVRLLEAASAANPAVSWVSVYAAGGTRLLTTNTDLAPMSIPDSGDEVRFAGARLTPGGDVGIVLMAPFDSRVVLVGFDVAALSAITSDRTGLGATGESLLATSSWISAGGRPVSGYLVINPSADVAAVAGSGSLAEAPAILADAFAAGDTDFKESDYRGTPIVASTRTLQIFGWKMIVKVDASEEISRVDELLSQMRSLGLSLGALVIFGGIFFGIYLARRIRKLADTVERIRQGELDLRLEVEGTDEVALLARSVNEFMDQLDRSSDIFQLGALRVLVVENNATNRHLLNELLTNWRMQAIVVGDGASALAAIEEAERVGEPIQLMVLDENLREINGVQLVEQFAEIEDSTRCPIIMLADDPSSVDKDALRKMGVGQVVARPLIASDLMEAILEEMGVSTMAMESMSDVLLTKVTPHEILLAEDSRIIQRVTAGFLEKWGHSVTIAENGRLAVEANRQKDFDLILMDLEMPEMNGCDATLAIRRDESEGQKRTPIVALTAKATKEDREECMAAGMDEYVSKPIDPKVLYRLVDSYPVATQETSMPPDGSHHGDEKESPVDWQIARSLTGGDEDLLDELIELFPVESSKHLDNVRAGIDTGDVDLLTRGAHSLKSAAGFFGAVTLIACALEVEDLGRASSITEAAERLATLEAETSRLTAALQLARPPA